MLCEFALQQLQQLLLILPVYTAVSPVMLEKHDVHGSVPPVGQAYKTQLHPNRCHLLMPSAD
jgi:hypothetical protein